jgi:dTDP-4-amino-4,6-dideoxygalactose transaminase
MAMKELFEWEDGDEIILPGLTFLASASAVLHCRLEPVFCDVDTLTFTMDTHDLPKRITGRTRAIMPVHIFGQPCDMGDILDTAEFHGVRVLEDSCESMFVAYAGKPVGSMGDAGAFSTYMSHLLTCGNGGIMTTDNDDIQRIARSIVHHGRDDAYLSIDDDDNLTSNEAVRAMVRSRFSFPRIGHNFRPTELEAALGAAQLENYGAIIEARAEVAGWYGEALAPYSEPLQLPTTAPGRGHAWMMYPIVCREVGICEDLMVYLERHAIRTRFLMPLLSQPALQAAVKADLSGQCPTARRVSRNGFFVGCHPGVTRGDCDFVANRIGAFLDGAR